MSEIVARLKKRMRERRSSGRSDRDEDGELMLAAAAEIERLQAALDRYRGEQGRGNEVATSHHEQSSPLFLWFP
jgi:hypothetical protein